jgi:hypothetical protein
MQSTGWGGARVGTGQKGNRELVEVTDTSLAAPPDDVPADEQGFWLEYASLAIEKGTLTKHTVPSWRLLCELDAEKRATRATLDKDGRTFLKVTVDGAGVEHQELKAHPLTGAYGRLAKAVEALMARFGLAPFGKAEPKAKVAVVNEWAEKVG